MKDIERIKVSDIVNYNWELGNRCNLLTEYNLDPYRNTEEEIMDFLIQSANESEKMEICLESSRCSAFHQSFADGITPFIDKDPIKLLEYKGRYWVYEGKHRICMAIRSKVEYIDALVHHLDYDRESLLEPYGVPGTYTFTAHYGIKRRTGENAILWVFPPKGSDFSIYSDGPRYLNLLLCKSCDKKEIIPGVYLEIKRKKSKKMLLSLSIEAIITIEPKHCNTKIWLYTIPAKRKNNMYIPKTIYRYGLWRKKHQFMMFPYDISCLDGN